MEKDFGFCQNTALQTNYIAVHTLLKSVFFLSAISAFISWVGPMNLFACPIIFHDNCHLLIFPTLLFFPNILSGLGIRVSKAWIQIRPDIMSGLIWVQTVCRVHNSQLAGKEFGTQSLTFHLMSSYCVFKLFLLIIVIT